MPGESNIYFKGTFVGKAYIDPANANDTLDLSLGRDKAINVKREQIKDFKKSSISGNEELTKAYEITVVNTKKQAIDIVIEDQVPISQNGDLTVDVQEISGANLDAQTGKLTWKINIPPGASIKKEIRFVAKFPKKKRISNL